MKDLRAKLLRHWSMNLRSYHLVHSKSAVVHVKGLSLEVKIIDFSRHIVKLARLIDA